MKNSSVCAIAILVIIAACKKDNLNSPRGDASEYITSKTVVVNPSGFAPLTAVLTMETSVKTRVGIKVTGKNGTDSDVTNEFEEVSSSHSIPILGLYGGYDNQVELTLFDEAGATLGTTVIPITTEQLSIDLPEIVIDVPPATSQHNMTLASYYGYSTGSQFPHNPFIFDDYGDIRWYIDHTNSDVLNQLSIQDGLEPLENGNLYFGDANSNAIYEMDMLGNILNTWPIGSLGYAFHHEVLEKPDGNFLVTVDKLGIATKEDFIIEISRETGAVVNVWDFRESMQYNRTAWTTNTEDWIHINAVEFDASDNSIIVSGRTQGLVKVDNDNNVKWILAPHREWGMSGVGVDLNTKLLQPLDAQGVPITDTGVLNGSVNHPDFEWNWYQHAPHKMADGGLICFDNGDTRNYKKDSLYSRAVKYMIDETTMTVRQEWQYGKERGVETYARFVSDVDFNEESGNIVFSAGAVNDDGPRHGKVVEIKANTADVVFEATVTPPATNGVTFHRTERIKLYR